LAVAVAAGERRQPVEFYIDGRQIGWLAFRLAQGVLELCSLAALPERG
jgi:hypothetical protein